MNKNRFETERLILVPSSVEDAELVLKSMNTNEFIDFVGDRNVRTIEDAETYIKEKHLPQIEKLGYGNFTIIEKKNGSKIGGVGLFHREGLDVVDIGFSFLPEFYGKGFGYEAASRILKAGFEDFGLKAVSAITVKENIASQKLIEKLGLKFKKIARIPNDPEDLLYYEISKEEFENLV